MLALTKLRIVSYHLSDQLFRLLYLWCHVPFVAIPCPLTNWAFQTCQFLLALMPFLSNHSFMFCIQQNFALSSQALFAWFVTYPVPFEGHHLTLSARVLTFLPTQSDFEPYLCCSPLLYLWHHHALCNSNCVTFETSHLTIFSTCKFSTTVWARAYSGLLVLSRADSTAFLLSDSVCDIPLLQYRTQVYSFDAPKICGKTWRLAFRMYCSVFRFALRIFFFNKQRTDHQIVNFHSIWLWTQYRYRLASKFCPHARIKVSQMHFVLDFVHRLCAVKPQIICRSFTLMTERWNEYTCGTALCTGSNQEILFQLPLMADSVQSICHLTAFCQFHFS